MSSILKRLPAEARLLSLRLTDLTTSYAHPIYVTSILVVLPPKAITLVVPSSDLKENTLEDRESKSLDHNTTLNIPVLNDYYVQSSMPRELS